MICRDSRSDSDRQSRLRREIFWSLLLLFAGGLLGRLCGDISGGILPEGLRHHIPLGHHGFVCPFCGGVRAFVYCCRLDLSGALHSSILGTLGTVHMLLTLPVRLLCFRPAGGARIRSLYRRLDRFESCDVFLILAAVCFLLQLALHCHADFFWFPLFAE